MSFTKIAAIVLCSVVMAGCAKTTTIRVRKPGAMVARPAPTVTVEREIETTEPGVDKTVVVETLSEGELGGEQFDPADELVTECVTRGVIWGERAVDCGNAADRQQLVAFCTRPGNATLELCRDIGIDRSPSDNPHALGADRVWGSRRGSYRDRARLRYRPGSNADIMRGWDHY